MANNGNAGYRFQPALSNLLNQFTNGVLDNTFLEEKFSELPSFDTAVNENMDSQEKRPLILVDGKFTLDNSEFNSRGDIVLDNKYRISAKGGKTVTFGNPGTAKFFPENNGVLDCNERGELLLKTFQIEVSEFLDVFNQYPYYSGYSLNVTDKVNINNLSSLIKAYIGNPDYMIHGYKRGSEKKIFFTHKKASYNDMALIRMTPKIINLLSDVENVIVYYGGKRGRGKRVDIEVTNRYVTLKFNFRNKNEGVFPKNLMCDYELHHIDELEEISKRSI